MSEHDELLRESYEGEVLGEAFFGALADATGEQNPARLERLRTLQAVERDTASTLRPLAEAAGIDTVAAKARADGVALAASTRDQPWDALLLGLRAALPSYFAKYERLRELAPDGEDAVLANLVAHERAVDRFAELELDGRAEESLAVLRAHLGASRQASSA